MVEIIFSVEKLNQKDRKIYDSMNSSEKEAFERSWVLIETQKAKLLQTMHKSRERNAREKKIQDELDRKARTKRLIERGAIAESYIQRPEEFSNEEFQEILATAMASEFIKSYIEDVRNRNKQEEEYYGNATSFSAENFS